MSVRGFESDASEGEQNTYVERVARYRIVYQRRMDDQEKACMRLNGMDPDNYWSLEWSFDDRDEAENQLGKCILITQKFGCNSIYRLVDNGSESKIIRSFGLF